MSDEYLYFLEMERREADLANDPNYQAEINGTPAALDYFTRAGQYYIIHKGFLLKLEKSSKPFTIAGVEIKKAAALNFSVTASVMSSYGVKINDSELIGLKKKYTYTNLYRGTPIQELNDCNFILSVISKHSVPLAGYKIDANYVANLQTVVTQLEQTTKLPQNMIKEHHNDLIMFEDHEKMVKKFYDEEMDPFMEIYRKFNMSLYLAYKAARKVRHHHLKRKPKPVDPEATMGTLEVMVLAKETMEPLGGVAFSAPQQNWTDVTDEDGEIYKDMGEPGEYSGNLFYEGRKIINFTFTLEAGKITALQFLMEKEEGN